MRISKKQYNNATVCCALSGAVVLIILWVMFYLKGYAPFGELSLAWEDATYQYIDLFAYLKDVLDGKNSITYSFSKSLGGTMIGVFSYYLASPLNILVKAFEKSDLTDFFDVLVSIKLSLSAVTFSAFLFIRFGEKITGVKEKGIVILTSVGYALGQYSIAQASNIMWLDGVYMLPLVLAGVYVLVRDNRMAFLSVAIALTVLFNWYTGGINCLFSGVWLCFEIALSAESQERKLHFVLSKMLRYAAAAITGVLISGALFLPMVGAMTKSAKGVFSGDNLFNLFFVGNFFAAVGNYVIGLKSEYGEVALFCGSMTLIGCLCALFSKDISKKKRIIFGIFLTFIFLSFSFKPLVSAFSLFKQARSFWYRYSYIGIFSLTFLSSCFFINSKNSTIYKMSLLCGVGAAFLVVYYSVLRYHAIHSNVIVSALLILLCGVLLRLVFSDSMGKRARKAACILLAALTFGETMLNVGLQMDNYHMEKRDVRKKYTVSSEKQWEELKLYDNSEYRTAQTYVYDVTGDGTFANFNEPLAYNYRGITSYTSSPDQNTIDFMENVGYRSYEDTLNEIVQPVLGVYSLLGVKYVASDYPLPFLDETVVGTNDASNITVYRNPYTFPMAFKYSPSSKQSLADDKNKISPFEYQNRLFRELTGTEEDVYYPVTHDIVLENNELKYSLNVPEEECVIYGRLPWITEKCDLIINGETASKYGGWLSSDVFYIPVKDKNAEVAINPSRLMARNKEMKIFYALNLKLLKSIADKMAINQADIIDIDDGKAYFSVESSGNENLLVSIPYDRDWTVKRNGEIVETELFGDCLYSIPLERGENEISFTYHVRYAEEGMLCTAIGLFMLLVEILVSKKRKAIFN